MGSLDPTHVMFLLFSVAIIAAVSGSIGSALARRKKSRTRAAFVAGFVTGLMTSGVLREQRHRLNVLRAVARRQVDRAGR